MNTPNYGWTLPDLGSSYNVWGTILNTLLTNVDAQAGQVWKPSAVTVSANNYAKTTNYLQIDDPSVSLTGVVAGKDGEILIIESFASLTDVNIVLPNNSGSSTAANRFASFDGTSNIDLFYNDRAIFIYFTASQRWVLKEIIRNPNEYTDAITGISWSASVAPTVDSANFKTSMMGGFCYLEFSIDNSAGGTSVTRLTFDLPPTIPRGSVDPDLTQIFVGAVSTRNGSTAIYSDCRVTLDTDEVDVIFGVSGAVSQIKGFCLIPIKGANGF